MDYEPLVNEDKDAGLRLVQLIHKSHPVQVAFWMKTSDNSGWRLYIAGDWVPYMHAREGLAIVLDAINVLHDDDIDFFRITVIPSSHPMALAAQEFWRKYPGSVPAFSRDSHFGETSVDQVYLYPKRMIEDPDATLFTRRLKTSQ